MFSIRSNKKGTLDFISKLNSIKLPMNFKMISLDIESLFPSVPLDESIEYASEIF